LPKKGSVLERLEYLAVQFIAKIHVPLGPIGEANVDRVILYVACVRNSRYHFCHSRGRHLLRRATALNQTPVLEKLVFVQIEPFEHKAERST
jgi:hypothetical protein